LDIFGHRHFFFPRRILVADRLYFVFRSKLGLILICIVFPNISLCYYYILFSLFAIVLDSCYLQGVGGVLDSKTFRFVGEETMGGGAGAFAPPCKLNLHTI